MLLFTKNNFSSSFQTPNEYKLIVTLRKYITLYEDDTFNQ
jgi:hypothetical protein